MNTRDTIAEAGGHKIVTGTDEQTDYTFYGFTPHEDVTFTNLYIGTEDVADTAVTYKAGIYYGCPRTIAPGYYSKFKLAGGIMKLTLTLDSPTKY